MENGNICKFSITRSSDLVCHNFVYETKNTLSHVTTAEHFLLGIVTRGCGTLIKGDHTDPLNEGSLFAVEAGDRFMIDAREADYCYIGFSGRRARELFDRAGIASGCSVFDGYSHLTAFWLDALCTADDGNLDLFTEAVLLYSFAHLKPTQKAHGDLVTKMMTKTDDSFTDPDFSLSRLSECLGYDAKYISALFRQKKGIPFTQYLRELRIRHALFLIEQGVVSVKNVALLSGFRDALYFSKIFKDSVGVPPKVYIEKLHGR